MKTLLSNATLFIGEKSLDIRTGLQDTDFSAGRSVEAHCWQRVDFLVHGRKCKIRDDANGREFTGTIEGQRTTHGISKISLTRFIIRLDGSSFLGGETGEHANSWS